MLQVYLVRHGETQQNAERHVQGQSDSPPTAKGEQQVMQAATRIKEPGTTYIISSNLGRTQRTARIIAQACGCDIILGSHLHELSMDIPEKRHINSLTEEEENWRRQLVNGTIDGRIPEDESMQELNDHVNAALESCQNLPQGSRPLLVDCGITPGCLVSMILELPA